jgi:hypothetical protein
MNNIPTKLKTEISDDPFYRVCIHERFRGVVGTGRLTLEHAIIYGGKQVQEKWAIVPCRSSFNNDVSGEEKEFNRYVAICRASSLDLARYPKRDWNQEIERLRWRFDVTPEQIRDWKNFKIEKC